MIHQLIGVKSSKCPSAIESGLLSSMGMRAWPLLYKRARPKQRGHCLHRA
jgi:hypothetical protein